MRKIFTTLKSVIAIAVIASMTLAASCSYDDSAINKRVDKVEKDLTALVERVEKLEESLQQQAPTLEELLGNKAVIVEVTTNEAGDTTIKLSNGKEITILAPADSLQYRVVDGVLEVSADGENWIVVNGVAGDQVVADVVISEDGKTATVILADGQEFVVGVAELIEFEGARDQVYVIAGASKEIAFAINDAVAEINIMNQPFGWSAEVEALDETRAVGGKNFVLKINGPAQELVAAGYAAKEGVVSVHFNTEAGACKVAKVNVNLAEITLDVDADGNITIVNSIAYEQTNYFGEKFTEFADFAIGIMEADVYEQYGEDTFTSNFDSWNGEYTANINFSKRATGLNNVVDLVPFEEGVYEKETIELTVDQLAHAFWPNYTFEYGKEYIVFITLDTELVQYYEQPILKNAVMADYSHVLLKAEFVESNWKGADFKFSLAGYTHYMIGWVSMAEVEQYISWGVASSVEEFIPFYVQNMGFSAGAVLAGDMFDETVALADLAARSVTEYAPALASNQEHVLYIYPFNAASEDELNYHQIDTANIINCGTFTTGGVALADFDAAAQFELVSWEKELDEYGYERDVLTAKATFGSDVKSIVYAWLWSPAADSEEGFYTVMNSNERYTVDVDGELTLKVAYPSDPQYLGVIAVNANGEGVYVEHKFEKPLPPATDVVATSASASDVLDITGYTEGEVQVDFTLENGETAAVRFKTGTGEDHNDDWYYYANMYINTGEWVDWNSSTNGEWWTNAYLNGSEASIKGAINVAYADGAYSFSFRIDNYNVTYTGAVEGLQAPANAEGGEEPVVPVEDSFTYLGRYYDLDDDDSTSGGDYVYKVVAGGVEYQLGLYYEYAEEDGTIKAGVYDYCYNAFDVMYSSWNGFIIKSDSYYYGSTLTANAEGVTLHLTDADGVLIGDYFYAGVPVSGDIEEPEQPAEPYVFTKALLEADYGFGDFYINFATEDEAVKIRLNFYNCSDDTKKYLPEMSYPVQTTYPAIYPDPNCVYSYVSINDTKYALDYGKGSVTVSEIEGKMYRFDIALVAGSGAVTVNGVYEGAIEGMIVPSDWVEPEKPEPGELQELTILEHSTIYTGSAEHEIGFYYSATHFVDIDFQANPITAGTYTLTDGLVAYYCKSHGAPMAECEAIVTENEDGTLTFDVTFMLNNDTLDRYHFTYTAAIYAAE